MGSLGDSLKPENLSLGGKIQDIAIDCTNSKKHPVLGFIGGRVVGVFIKPAARITDVVLHIILAVGKTLVGITITLPIQFVAFCLNKKYDTNWNVKQGVFHLGYAIVYTGDVFASPILNLISPNIYSKKKKDAPKPPNNNGKPLPEIGRNPQPQPVINPFNPYTEGYTKLQGLLAEREGALALANQEKGALAYWIQQKDQQHNSQIQQFNADIAALRVLLVQKEAALHNANQQIAILAQARQLNDSQNARQIQQLGVDIDNIKQALAQKEAALANESQQKAHLALLLQQKEQQYAAQIHNLGEEIRQLRDQVADKDRAFNAAQQQNLIREQNLQMEKARLENELKQEQDKLIPMQEQQARFVLQVNQLQKTIADLQENVRQKDAAIQAAVAGGVHPLALINDLNTKLREAEDQLKQARVALDQLQKNNQDQTVRVKSLEDQIALKEIEMQKRISALQDQLNQEKARADAASSSGTGAPVGAPPPPSAGGPKGAPPPPPGAKAPPKLPPRGVPKSAPIVPQLSPEEKHDLAERKRLTDAFAKRANASLFMVYEPPQGRDMDILQTKLPLLEDLYKLDPARGGELEMVRKAIRGEPRLAKGEVLNYVLEDYTKDELATILLMYLNCDADPIAKGRVINNNKGLFGFIDDNKGKIDPIIPAEFSKHEEWKEVFRSEAAVNAIADVLVMRLLNHYDGTQLGVIIKTHFEIPLDHRVHRGPNYTIREEDPGYAPNKTAIDMLVKSNVLHRDEKLYAEALPLFKLLGVSQFVKNYKDLRDEKIIDLRREPEYIPTKFGTLPVVIKKHRDVIKEKSDEAIRLQREKILNRGKSLAGPDRDEKEWD